MKELYKLVEVMKKLRGENGCPWDHEQTHETLKPYLLEEAYEVVNAIDSKLDNELEEELGDLLLQIVFHAQIASEQGRFTIDDVARTIVNKLIRRHPHVFSETKVNNSEEVLENWEEIKKGEGKESVLDGVPESLPALLKARRVQEKVKRVGFDWDNIQGAFEKVLEEFKELKDAVGRRKKKEIEDEFGDILFSIVNISRFMEIDAEDSLRKTINKFKKRFQYIEQKVNKLGNKPLKNHSIHELDALWEESKNA